MGVANLLGLQHYDAGPAQPNLIHLPCSVTGDKFFGAFPSTSGLHDLTWWESKSRPVWRGKVPSLEKSAARLVTAKKKSFVMSILVCARVTGDGECANLLRT